MKNPYKRLNIFKCVHDAHRAFESRMSAHHILNVKGCFPGGCFHFQWNCKLMKQGKKCYRGYNYIGKNCSGCRYFYEDKVHNHPEVMLSDADYRDFQAELRQFEDWLEEHRNRECEIHGVVDGVKPLFRKKVYARGNGFSFAGFLLIFRELYIGRELMEDPVYVRLSPKTYASLKFGRGDKLTARATLSLDRGRLVFTRLRRIDIEERGEPPQWSESEALVARESATLMPGQPEGCQHCPYGALVDVEDQSKSETRHYRQLYCLQGVKDYRICPVYSGYAGADESAEKLPSNQATCVTQRVRLARKS